MWPDGRLTALFKIDHPIIPAPMAGWATAELASIVSNIGGLGSVVCSQMPVPDIRAAAAKMRALTKRPFNLNYFIQPAPKTDAEVLRRMRERLQPWYAALALVEVPGDLPALGSTFGAEHLAVLLEVKAAAACQVNRCDGDKRVFRPVGPRKAVAVRGRVGEVTRSFAGISPVVRLERTDRGGGSRRRSVVPTLRPGRQLEPESTGFGSFPRLDRRNGRNLRKALESVPVQARMS
jgi:hypothetical protein